MASKGLFGVVFRSKVLGENRLATLIVGDLVLFLVEMVVVEGVSRRRDC